jgi:hypothetical protein
MGGTDWHAHGAVDLFERHGAIEQGNSHVAESKQDGEREHFVVHAGQAEEPEERLEALCGEERR